MSRKLFLLDGHALVYRAHFAFITRPLINSKGQNVSAIQGFLRFMWDIIQNEQATHLAVVFDPPTATFRHERFEAYKANRDATPEDISMAIPWITKTLKAMRIPVEVVPNYEADDVIGTLAKQAEQQGFKVLMVTPDKDYGQLVSEQIALYKPGRQGNEVEIMGPKEVCEKWGIQRVDQVIDMLGLMGDAVDNIPGLPGIGEKTAAKLLAEYDSVENLIAHAHQLKGKQQEIVTQHADKATLSKWLATIDVNSPVQFDEKHFELEPFDREALMEIFRELEFRSLADAILRSKWAGAPAQAAASAQPAKSPVANAGAGMQGSLFGDEPLEGTVAGSAASIMSPRQTLQDVPHTYHLADTPALRAELIALLMKATAICYDSETTALDATQAELVGLSFAITAGEAWYVPVPAERAEAQAIVEEFRPVFESVTLEKVGQNLKYDAIVLKNYDCELRGPYWDTMLAHYLIEPELRHNMNYMAETYLNYSPIKIETLIGGKGAKQGTMRDVTVEKIKDYAAEDADVTIRLRDYLAPKLAERGDKGR
jgi:DNA polymerase I